MQKLEDKQEWVKQKRLKEGLLIWNEIASDDSSYDFDTDELGSEPSPEELFYNMPKVQEMLWPTPDGIHPHEEQA